MGRKDKLNNLLNYKGYYGTVEYSAADNLLFGKVVGIRGLISYEGAGIDELRKDFEVAVDEYLEDCMERGVEPLKQYKGRFQVKIPPELHRNLSLYAVSRGETINAAVEEAIRNMVNAV